MCHAFLDLTVCRFYSMNMHLELDFKLSFKLILYLFRRLLVILDISEGLSTQFF